MASLGKLSATAVVVVSLCVSAIAAPPVVDPAIKPYQPVAGVSGNLNGQGSDTLNNLMQLWGEGFQKVYPTVKVQYIGPGSNVAPTALTEGTAQLGPMSRAMKESEIDLIEKKFGFKPTRLIVALDCLAVYVNKDNPVKGLTLQQLDCIFSSTRKSGFADIKTWGEAGVTDPSWARLPISMYGRDSASGTNVFFRDVALLKGDWKDSVKTKPGSAAVVQAVGEDKAGIGYSGIGYKTAEVRAIPLAKDADSDLVEPTFENALAGKYPLGRALYIYIIKKPGEPAPLLVREFLKFVLSKEGQEIVIKDGFGPLPAKIVEEQLKLLE